MAPLSMLRAMSSQPILVSNAALAEHARRASGYAAILGMLCALFAARVAAQAMQRWLTLPFLPPASAFQGSALPYAVLLPLQLAILATMLRIARRVHIGSLPPRSRYGNGLTLAGALYVAVMLTRLAVGLTVPNAPAWFRSEISTVFHFVLALFVLVLAAYHRQPQPRHPRRVAS